jgi:hypothetical protein
VISVGVPTPILFAFTSWRLRHLQISTTPATAPAHSLQAQHNETCALLDGAPPQLIKSVVEFWCGAKKQLSF